MEPTCKRLRKKRKQPKRPRKRVVYVGYEYFYDTTNIVRVFKKEASAQRWARKDNKAKWRDARPWRMARDYEEVPFA
jgi:hypothetical protein